jgi:hypothetical protein
MSMQDKINLLIVERLSRLHTIFQLTVQAWRVWEGVSKNYEG